jgi:hypothetical protein
VMKRARYYTTIQGKRATRRIKWFNPKGIIHENGKQYVAAFVLATLGETGLKLRAVTSQLGIDGRGKWVIPGVMDCPDPMYTAAYSVGLEVGKLEQGATYLINQLNEQLERERENNWQPVAGTRRGIVSDLITAVEDQAVEHLPINRLNPGATFPKQGV